MNSGHTLEHPRLDIYFTLFAFLILLIVSQISKSTYDTGDSVMHYLYARYVIQDPNYLLNLWAKPLFLIASAPFASFGFNGMKVFQALIWTTAIFFTIRICRLFGFRFPVLAGVFMLSMPKLVLSTASGLTEPMFAAWMIAAIYFAIKGDTLISTILFSFLLFIRQEGMVVDIIVLVYLIFSGKARYIPWLFVSLLISAIIGIFFYRDPLWYFTHNPYNGPPGTYGYGSWWWILYTIPYHVGTVLSGIIVLGLIVLVRFTIQRFFLRKDVPFFNERFFLIYSIAIGFIFFHSIACWKGLFGSYCLDRVLLCIHPLFGIITVEGFYLLYSILYKWNATTAKIVSIIIIAAVVIFPVSGSSTAYKIPADFQHGDQLKLIDSAAAYVHDNRLEGQIYFSDPCTPIAFGDIMMINPKTKDYFPNFENPHLAPKGSIYVWDSYSKDFNITVENLLADSAFTKLKTFYNPAVTGNPKIILFRKN